MKKEASMRDVLIITGVFTVAVMLAFAGIWSVL